MATYYTNAPEAYDYHCTTTLRVTGKDKVGRDIRLVRIAPVNTNEDDMVQSQVDRYFSGLFWGAEGLDEAERYAGSQLKL